MSKRGTCHICKRELLPGATYKLQAVIMRDDGKERIGQVDIFRMCNTCAFAEVAILNEKRKKEKEKDDK